VVPPILEAVKVYATLGEISDTLREVFGEYRERYSNPNRGLESKNGSIIEAILINQVDDLYVIHGFI